jgi:protein-S-isoprenylcysteine O-methyltransferase Ste14
MWLLLKTAVFVAIVPGTVAVYVPYLITGRMLFEQMASASGWHLAGWLLAVFGCALAIYCVIDFVSRGRGTPAPLDPPRKLVVKGAYSFTRNPMYIAVSSFVFGLAVLTGSWALVLYGTGLSILFHFFVVYYEEPGLKKRFGSSYEEYCRTVSRWFWR